MRQRLEAALAPGPDSPPEPSLSSSELKWKYFYTLAQIRDMKPGLTVAMASFWLGRGFRPIPIAPKGKNPLFTDWGTKKPTIELWSQLDRRTPLSNIGLLLGTAGGLIDLDIDDPVAAAPVLARMFPNGLPATLGWSTTEGRFHLLFRWEPRLARYGKTVIRGLMSPNGKIIGNPNYPGLEIRIGSSPGTPKSLCAVIAPSRMDDGTSRRWNDGFGIWPLPESVFDDLDKFAITQPPTSDVGVRSAAAGDGQKKGWARSVSTRSRARRSRRRRPDAETRAAMYLAKCEPAIQGQNGSGACFKAACKLGPGFDLPTETTVRLMMQHYNPRCSPPWKEEEIRLKVDDAYKSETRRGWLLEG